MIHPVALRLAIFVTGLFVLVIVVWVTVFQLASTVDTHRMTPAEESQILSQRQSLPSSIKSNAPSPAPNP